MDSAVALSAERAREAGRTLPVTERVLARLGGPRPLWIVAWAAIALLSPAFFTTAIRLSGGVIAGDELVNLLATQAVLGYAALVFLWGAGVLHRRALVAQTEVMALVAVGAPTDVFLGVGSVRAPLMLTAAVVAISTANNWVSYGPLPALVGLPLIFAYLTPILAFVWVYLSILAGLDRLGRQTLVLDRFPQDRSLGLERLGSLASSGLGIVLLAGVPVMLATSDEPVSLAISLVIVSVTLGVFVLSMWRLHGQMAAAKARFVAVARRLYAEAYAPLRDQPTLATLDARASSLGAARALDERAQSILTWPIDEGTVRFIAVVVTGVVTSLVVRALFAAAGF